MPIKLTKKLEAEVARRVRAGSYHSADELIREGLKLVARRDELRAEIQKGLTSPSERYDLQELKDEVRVRIVRSRTRKRA